MDKTKKIEIGKSGMVRDDSSLKPRYDLIESDFFEAMADRIDDTGVRHWIDIANDLLKININTDLDTFLNLTGDLMKFDALTNKNCNFEIFIEGNYVHYWHQLANRLSGGAKHYGENNWKKANGTEEYKSFIESFVRHAFEVLMDWIDEEDVVGSVMFNCMGLNYMLEKGYIDGDSEYQEL